VVSNYGFRVVSEIFSVEKYRDLEIRVRGHSWSLKVVPFDRFPIVFYSNFVPKMNRFLRYSTVKNVVTLKSGQRSLKVIRTGTCRTATYDFLLMFYSNHGPNSHRFRNRRRFQSKIANFSHSRVFCAPADGVPFGIGYRRGVRKKWNDGLPDGSKSFKICLAFPFRHNTGM